jgi:hypothetical protein
MSINQFNFQARLRGSDRSRAICVRQVLSFRSPT